MPSRPIWMKTLMYIVIPLFLNSVLEVGFLVSWQCWMELGRCVILSISSRRWSHASRLYLRIILTRSSCRTWCTTWRQIFQRVIAIEFLSKCAVLFKSPGSIEPITRAIFGVVPSNPCLTPCSHQNGLQALISLSSRIWSSITHK